MAEEGEKRSDNRLLVGVLAFLVVVIVGLVAGIFIVRTNESSDGDGQSQEEIEEDVAPRNPVSLQSKIYEEAEVILVNGGQDAYGDAMKCFDDAMLSVSDYDTIFGLKIMRIYLLINYEYFNEALGYTNELSGDNLGVAEKGYIYDFYRLIYEGLGDLEKVDEYEKLLQENLKEVNRIMEEEEAHE